MPSLLHPVRGFQHATTRRRITHSRRNPLASHYSRVGISTSTVAAAAAHG